MEIKYCFIFLQDFPGQSWSIIEKMGQLPPEKVSIPDSARHAPERNFRKEEMTIRIQWPIGTFLRCRKHVRLWGASRHDDMVVEMPMKWHGRIRAQLSEWTNEPVNRWTNEPVNQWSNEAMTQWTNQPANQRVDKSTVQWINEWMR
jgi:hypothetical protein